LKVGAKVVPGGMNMAKRTGVVVGRRANLVKAGTGEAAAEVLAVVAWKAGVPGVNVEAKVGKEVAAAEALAGKAWKAGVPGVNVEAKVGREVAVVEV
jgi:hypothetical protein